MNSEEPERDSSAEQKGTGNRTQYMTVVGAASLAFLFTLAVYTWKGGTASSRPGYAMFVSAVPAVGVFLLLRLTKISLKWRGVAALYFILFLLVAAIAMLQGYTQFR